MDELPFLSGREEEDKVARVLAAFRASSDRLGRSGRYCHLVFAAAAAALLLIIASIYWLASNSPFARLTEISLAAFAALLAAWAGVQAILGSQRSRFIALVNYVRAARLLGFFKKGMYLPAASLLVPPALIDRVDLEADYSDARRDWALVSAGHRGTLIYVVLLLSLAAAAIVYSIAVTWNVRFFFPYPFLAASIFLAYVVLLLIKSSVFSIRRSKGGQGRRQVFQPFAADPGAETGRKKKG